MKKITLFMAFLLSFMTAVAADFTLQEGKKYVFKCKNNSKIAIYNEGSVSSSDNTVNVLSNWLDYDYRSFFTVTAIDGNYFTIQVGGDATKYVYAINTNDASSNVGVKTIAEGETVDDACKWQFVSNGDNTWNVIPKDGACGWNCRGSNGGNAQIGQWSSNDTDDNRWYIMTVGEFAQQLLDGYSSLVGNTIGYLAQLNNVSATIIDNLNSEVNATNTGAFKNAVAAQNNIYLPDGYYTVKSLDEARYGCLYNDYFKTANTEHLTLLSQNGAATNNYTWKVTRREDGTSIVLANGEGSSLNTKKSGSVTTHSQLDFGNFLTDKPTSIYFTQALNCVNSEFSLSDGTHYVTTWTAGGSAKDDNRWVFTPVSVDGKYVYDVKINLNSATVVANLTRNSTGEKAINGGFFISDEVLTASDLTASSIEHYSSEISIEGQTITVTYTEKLEEYKAAAQALLNIKGVGYPAEGSQARAILKAAIDAAQSIETLQATMTAYKATTTDIQLPEDGHAYKFTNVQTDGSKLYMHYAEGGVTFTSSEEGQAVFICRKLDGEGKYAFVNDEGKYLIWRGSSAGANGKKGYVDTYDYEESGKSDWTQITISKMVKTETVPVENEDLFGYVLFYGRRSASLFNYTVTRAAGTGGYDQGSNPYFQNEFSSALLMTEVEDYKNNAPVGAADGVNGDDVKVVGTFSASYPAVLPEGVAAYYVKNDPKDAARIRLEKIEIGENEALPANTGVVLASTNAALTKAMIKPAAGETAVTVEGNMLVGTCGSEVTVPTTDNAFVLAHPTGKDVGFYKLSSDASKRTIKAYKAYLVLSTEQSALGMDFGGSAPTGLNEMLTSTPDANAPIYDLSGRRVMKASHGIYIQGGKKVLVK